MKPTTRHLFLALIMLLLVIGIIPAFMGMMGSGMMSGADQPSGWTWGLMLAVGSLRIIAVVGALIVGILLFTRFLSGVPSSR